jgi:hypothetical protein
MPHQIPACSSANQPCKKLETRNSKLLKLGHLEGNTERKLVMTTNDKIRLKKS